jgi:EAL domain-containing protein (putative c-di-GMP-specific phosphodiesterase class I)
MLAFISEQFTKWKIPTHKVCFEITETAAISNLSYAANFIQQLKAQGCQFSLDDFGSGLSSFAYLKNLPVDYLKIDGLFVKDILEDEVDLAMVKSINEVGHVMKKKTIAEFVENEAIFNLLKSLGIDYAQGYGIGKPVPLDDLKPITSLFDKRTKH